MAKTTPGLKAALAAVNAAGKAMNREAMGDYKVGLSASKAGTANLRAQTGQNIGDLLSGVKGQQMGLRSGLRNAKLAKRQVGNQQDATVNRYGTALGASIGQSFGQARATASAGVMNAKGAVGAGKSALQAAHTVSGIAKQATTAQQAAAKYALSQALMARNITDAGTIAGITGQLYQTALQSQMAWDLWKKQQDYTLKKEKEDATGQLGGMNTVADRLTHAAVVMRGYLVDSEEPMTPQELVNKYVSEQGVLNESELAAITALSQRLPGENVQDRSMDVNNVLDSLHTLFPKFHGQRNELYDLINKQMDAEYGTQVLANTTAAVTGEQTSSIDQGVPVTEPTKAQQISAAGGKDPSKVREITIQYGDQAGQKRYVDSDGYIINEQPDVTTGVAAAQDGSTMGTTPSGRQYRYQGGKPFYQDSGYLVPADDLP